MPEVLLVIGIHREELAFGDQVADLIDQAKIDLMRIPQGISHARTGTDDGFYFETRHREIYLQLHQQVKKNYRLIIDLHCGRRSNGNYAELFSSDDSFIACLNEAIKENGWHDEVRVIKIIAERPGPVYDVLNNKEQPKARTWIPERVWSDSNYRYIGLEIYLVDEASGSVSEMEFAAKLIETITQCEEQNLD